MKFRISHETELTLFILTCLLSFPITLLAMLFLNKLR